MVCAGTHGVGVLSLGAGLIGDKKDLAAEWDVGQRAAAAAGRELRREDWRLVIRAHVAETREEAIAAVRAGRDHEREHYYRRVAGMRNSTTLEEEIEQDTSIIGTPDDMIAALRRLQDATGGFGGFMVLANDWASHEATLRSYELIALRVIPELRGHLDSLRASYDMVAGNKRAYGGPASPPSAGPTTTPANQCPWTSIPAACADAIAAPSPFTVRSVAPGATERTVNASRHRTAGRDGRRMCHQRTDYVGDVTASAAHPVDAAGLVLPEPSWPDRPGSAGALEPLRRFCNTTNRENGADAWRTTRELADWLAGEGYRTVGRLDAAARARLLTMRDALWQGVRTGDFGALVALAGSFTVRLEPVPRGIAVVPAGSGVDAVVSRLVLAVADATARWHARAPQVLRPLPVGVPRHVEEPPRTVVLDGGVRRPREGTGLPGAPGRDGDADGSAVRCGRRRAATAAVLAVLLTTGCHDDGPGASAPRGSTALTTVAPSTTDAAPGETPLEVPGITAILEQYREDEIQGLISVKTTNRSASTLEFLDLRLEWPGIATHGAARPPDPAGARHLVSTSVCARAMPCAATRRSRPGARPWRRRWPSGMPRSTVRRTGARRRPDRRRGSPSCLASGRGRARTSGCGGRPTCASGTRGRRPRRRPERRRCSGRSSCSATMRRTSWRSPRSTAASCCGSAP